MLHKLFILFCIAYSVTISAQTVNDQHRAMLEHKEHPCEPHEDDVCEIKIEVPILDDQPVSKRATVGRARSLCESFPFRGKKLFTSREADGDGLVYSCRVERKEFLRWWSSVKNQ